jgi:uncharacterized SAM-binding protein YcdF (DUF218 family)
MTDFENAQIIWDYMRFEQPLKKADVIIGLGSTDIRTAEWCAKLYHDGYAPYILFTGARGRMTREAFTENEADVYAERAIELDVPESVILKESRTTNTGENIIYSHRLLQEMGLSAKSLIIVTKPYMLRRAYATFMKQWPDETKPDIQCSAIDVSFAEYCEDEMYPFDYVTNVMVGDLQRIR